MNIKSHQENSRGIRFIAFVTVFVFVVTSVSWNSPVSAAPPETIPTVFSSIGKLVIPAEMGSIQRRFLGTRSSGLGKMKDKNGSLVPSPDSRCVVLIQDAHAVIDAQENIRKILGHLRKEYGVSLTALEGAKGRLEPLLLRTFPEPHVKRKILADYEKRAELSGPEMESVFQETPGEFVGMEDWALYEKNYGAYLAAQNNKDSLMTQWQTFKKSLDAERSKVFDSQLNEFQDAWEGYASDKSSLLDLLTYLSRFSKQLKTGSDYQELPGLISLMGYEKTGKQSVLEPMVRKMADDFKTKYLRGLGVKATANFFSRYQAFMTGQITTGQMLQYLVHLGAETGKKPKLTPALKMLLGHAQTLSEIKGSRLYDELQRFLPEVQESLVRNTAQRELAEKYQRLFLLKDMIALELTHEDLAKYQRESKGYLSLIRSPAFEENLRSALEFYKAALERDRVFMSKIEALMQKQTHNQRPATIAVVAGGFHTIGLERILREKGIAYTVVTPKIASLAGSENYFKVMNGDVSFKEYLNTTYFDALMRHSAKALTEALPIPDQARTLKAWRDNVIRELASEGRIAEAGKYLPYIDALLQNHGEAVSVGSSRSNEKILSVLRTELEKAKKDLFERIWKTFEFQLGTFTDDLKELMAQKDLNTQTVSALIDRASQTKPSFLGLRAALSRAPVPFPILGVRRVIGPGLFARSETRMNGEPDTGSERLVIAAGREPSRMVETSERPKKWRVFLKKAGVLVSILFLGATHAAAMAAKPMGPIRPPEDKTNEVSSVAAQAFGFLPPWLRPRRESDYPPISLRPPESTLRPISRKPLVSPAAEEAAIAFLGVKKFNGYLNLYSPEDRDTLRYMIQILARTNPGMLQYMVDRPIHIVRLPNDSKEFTVTSNLYTNESDKPGIVLDDTHIGLKQSEWELFDKTAKAMLAENQDGLNKSGPVYNFRAILSLKHVVHELSHLRDEEEGRDQGSSWEAVEAREKRAIEEQERMEMNADVGASPLNDEWDWVREYYREDYVSQHARTVRNQLIIGMPGAALLVFALFLKILEKHRAASVPLPDKHKPLPRNLGKAPQQPNLSYLLSRQRGLKGARLNSKSLQTAWRGIRPGSRPSTPRRSEVRSEREGLLGKFVGLVKANPVRAVLLMAAPLFLTSCVWVRPHGAEVASGSGAALTEGRLSWADVNVTDRMKIASSTNTSPEELLGLVEDTIRRLKEFDPAKFNKARPDHYDQGKVDDYMALGTVFYVAAGNPYAAIATNRNAEGKTLRELLVEARGKLGQGPVNVGEEYASARIPEEFELFTDLFKSVGTGFWNSTDPFLPKEELEGFAGWSSDPLVNPFELLPWDEDVLHQLASWTGYFFMTQAVKEALLLGMIVTPHAADTKEAARLEMVKQWIRMSAAVTYPLSREEWLRVFSDPDPVVRCNGLRGLNVPPEVAAQALKDNWENFIQGVAVEKEDLLQFLPSMETIKGAFLDWDSPDSIWKQVEGSPTKVRLNTPLFRKKTDDDFRLAVGTNYDATTLQEYLEFLRAHTASEFPSWHPLKSSESMRVWSSFSGLENTGTNRSGSVTNSSSDMQAPSARAPVPIKISPVQPSELIRNPAVTNIGVRRSEVRSKGEGLLEKLVGLANAKLVRGVLLMAVAGVLTSCVRVRPHGAEVASGSVAVLTEGRLSWADANVTNRMKIANSPDTSPEELLGLVEDTIRRLKEFKFNRKRPDHYDQGKVDDYMALGAGFYALAWNPSAMNAPNRNAEGKTIQELLVAARGKLGPGPVAVGTEYKHPLLTDDQSQLYFQHFASVGTDFWNSTDPFLPKKDAALLVEWSPEGELLLNEDTEPRIYQLAVFTRYVNMPQNIMEALLFGRIKTPPDLKRDEAARIAMFIKGVRINMALTYPLSREQWVRVSRDPDPVIRCNALLASTIPVDLAARALRENWDDFTHGVAVEKEDLLKILPHRGITQNTFLDWDALGSIWDPVAGFPTKVRLNTSRFRGKTPYEWKFAVGKELAAWKGLAVWKGLAGGKGLALGEEYDETALQEYLEFLRAHTANEFPAWHPLQSAPARRVWMDLSPQRAPASLNTTTNTGASSTNSAILPATRTGNSSNQNPATNTVTIRPEARQSPLSTSPKSAVEDQPTLERRSELRFFKEPLLFAVAEDREGVVALARTAGTGTVRATLRERGRAILAEQSGLFEMRLRDWLFRMQSFLPREFQERVLAEGILRVSGDLGIVTPAMAAEIATRAVAGDAEKSGALSEFIDGRVTWKRDELARMVRDKVALRRAMTMIGTSHGPYALMTEWKGTAGDAPLLRLLSSLELSRLILLSDGDEKVHLNRAMLAGVAPIVQVHYQGGNVESAIGQANRQSKAPVLCLFRTIYDFTLEHQYTLTLEDQRIVTPELRDLALEVARAALLIFMVQDEAKQQEIIAHPEWMIPLLKQYGVMPCVEIGRNGQLFVNLVALMSSYVTQRAFDRAA